MLSRFGMPNPASFTHSEWGGWGYGRTPPSPDPFPRFFPVPTRFSYCLPQPLNRPFHWAVGGHKPTFLVTNPNLSNPRPMLLWSCQQYSIMLRLLKTFSTCCYFFVTENLWCNIPDVFLLKKKKSLHNVMPWQALSSDMTKRGFGTNGDRQPVNMCPSKTLVLKVKAHKPLL